MYFNKYNRKILAYMYRQKKATAQEMTCKFGPDAFMTLFWMGMENFVSAQRPSGKFVNFKDMSEIGDREMEYIVLPKAQEFVENDRKKTLQYWITTVIAVLALILAVISLLLQQPKLISQESKSTMKATNTFHEKVL